MKATPRAVLKALNEGRQHQRRPPLRWGFKIEKQLKSFLSWCDREGIDDPLSYVKTWLEICHHEGYEPVTFRMKSKKLAERWKVWLSFQNAEEEHQKQLHAQSGNALQQRVVSLKLLTRANEAMKKQYAHTERCVAEVELTGGWHPRSRYCQSCPLAGQCAAALERRYGFNVAALRTGHLHMVPRSVAAAAVR